MPGARFARVVMAIVVIVVVVSLILGTLRF